MLDFGPPNLRGHVEVGVHAGRLKLAGIHAGRPELA